MHGLYNAKVQSRFPVLVGISTMTLQEKRQIIGIGILLVMLNNADKSRTPTERGPRVNH